MNHLLTEGSKVTQSLVPSDERVRYFPYNFFSLSTQYYGAIKSKLENSVGITEYSIKFSDLNFSKIPKMIIYGTKDPKT